MSRADSKQPCSSRGFIALLFAQFFGAINDNLFKLFVTLLVVNKLIQADSGITHLVLINICFIMPYILFSAFAGSLADRLSKSLIVRGAKLLEICVMVAAMIFLPLQNTYALLFVLFFMGTQSTIFSPSKYGMLPEILDEFELSKGNGYLEFSTFIGIIIGTAVAGLVLTQFDFQSGVPGGILVVLAILGFLASLLVTRTDPAAPESRLKYNPFSVFSALKDIRENKGLFLTVVAIAYFWSIGALYQLNLVLYGKVQAGLGDLGVSLQLACLGVGIGAGSIVAGKVSEGKVELGLVPLGAIGLAISSILLTFTAAYPVLTGLILLGVGFSAGFYIVPLNAYLQENSPSGKRGNFIAASNFVSFVGMLIFSLSLLFLIDGVGIRPGDVFLVSGLSAIVIAVYICSVLPEVLLRCINWILVHAVYRLKVYGEENIPRDSGALLVCNHVSMADACLLLASLKRPVRFLMFRPFYEAKFIHPFAKAMGAIPIESGASRETTENALAGASEAVKRGELVCIFAEGAITRTGQLLKFRRGLERIMSEAGDAPIIPVHLDEVWGSIFSFRHGKVFWKMPKRIPYGVTIHFGDPMPAESPASDVRLAVQELSAKAYGQRPASDQLLSSGFIRSAKRLGFRRCMSDTTGSKHSWFSALAASLVLRGGLSAKLREEKYIGVLLPPSCAGALSNIALLMAGKIPVNLNPTVSEEAFASAVSQCEIKTILTSKLAARKLKKYLEKASPLYLEDVVKESSTRDKVLAWLAAVLLPQRVLEKCFVAKADPKEDAATVLFSSGSTGEPKGVVLTHQNISSNCTAINDLYSLSQKDGIAGVLPFFHSFGFTGTLWLPLLAGCRAAYHHTPLAAAEISELIRKEKLSGLMSTPIFLASYTKRCKAEDLTSLKYIMVGAQKLTDKVRNDFVEKFGVEPLEGYGCTELSPLAVVNVPDYREGRVKQVGHKPGTVGHPIPGVAVKVVDPDTKERMAVGEQGLLLVKGPNVMKGYLNKPELTNEVVEDAWYSTGDIAVLDPDGFVKIVDRLSRFSKIGGEMVPHIAVEEKIQETIGADEQVCAVTSVADEQKGERLVVLLAQEFEPDALVSALRDAGLPNLWIPKKEDLLKVEELPCLGSGKLDLKGVKKIAESRVL